MCFVDVAGIRDRDIVADRFRTIRRTVDVGRVMEDRDVRVQRSVDLGHPVVGDEDTGGFRERGRFHLLRHRCIPGLRPLLRVVVEDVDEERNVLAFRNDHGFRDTPDIPGAGDQPVAPFAFDDVFQLIYPA
ncbi:MAG: hypothetical protein BWY06_03205 [Candidatus Latescibacteria bacterium ADurb.Bin168]|nr:MAG: hypothetical protein BWY06_03205 [Candidatus Latescibacteria bacterium ADurb.Bin168]